MSRRRRPARRSLRLAGAVAFAMAALPAHGGGACSAPEAHDFDFWIGDWDIRQRILGADGEWLQFEAHASVAPALGGCALVERWEGMVQFFWEGMEQPLPMQGLSVRAYDPASDRWYIHWMDTRTLRFDAPYAGRFERGRGEFFRQLDTPEGKRTMRITFSDIGPASVDWELAISRDDGGSWSPLWIMEMVKAGD